MFVDVKMVMLLLFVFAIATENVNNKSTFTTINTTGIISNYTITLLGVHNENILLNHLKDEQCLSCTEIKIKSYQYEALPLRWGEIFTRYRISKDESFILKVPMGDYVIKYIDSYPSKQISTVRITNLKGLTITLNKEGVGLIYDGFTENILQGDTIHYGLHKIATYLNFQIIKNSPPIFTVQLPDLFEMYLRMKPFVIGLCTREGYKIITYSKESILDDTIINEISEFQLNNCKFK